ncbi:heavy metal translocating P-type ATPase [Acidithiobacillus sp. AMEEHan]|uniref:heavy metal translocating P-type ATPase n=1 Tax=Acidithiobacillus sp. AMEEHan TaxID=2994951 RepID=UPI0027E58452|nr:heavy metal translocating P-type ATPase [Acidithiobacillus sp. AMEEHan]
MNRTLKPESLDKKIARTPSTQRLRVGVTGMTCASCSNRVERALNKVAGVEANVNLATETADIQFDPAQTPASAVVAAIEKAGYGTLSAQAQLAVEGMTCASCSSRVERTLRRLTGVLEASVNLATERAQVRYLPASISVDEMIAAIQTAGYGARNLDRSEEAEEDGHKAAILRAMGRDVLLAVSLALIVLLLAMGSAFSAPFAHWLQNHAPLPRFWEGVQFILTSIVLFWPGRRFFRPGWIAYRHLSPDMNSLVATGTGAAWLYSSLVLFVPFVFPASARHLYFDSAAVVIAAVLLGKYLEEIAKGRSSAAIYALLQLQTKTARRIDAQGQEEEVAISQLRLGDHLLVRPGERVPADGRVLDGSAHVDEAMLNGEPIPQKRAAGAEVYAGTFCQDGRLRIEVTRLGKDSVLAQIIALVESAQSGKLPIQSLADRVIRIFSPLVLAIALLSFLFWSLYSADVSLALATAVAVLVVACPCAMGLATPAAIMVGTGRAAELGVLFRKGSALEMLAEVDTILFDKTGTVTCGHPTLVARGGAQEALTIAAAVERDSEHPIARAIVHAVPELVLQAENFQAVAGQGVEGQLAGAWVRVGTREFLAQQNIAIPEDDELRTQEAVGATIVFVAQDGRYLGWLAVADALRAEAPAVCAALRQMGMDLALVTGDGEIPAHRVAKQLGIEAVHARILPQDKANVVREYQTQGRRVAFIGDGINDAPALAQADVGVALASGTEIAMEAADVTLSHPDLGTLVTALRAARQTLGRIRGNLFWAFFYNILLLPLAAGVFLPWGVQLNPMLAGVAMGFSSIFVLGNSLRLRRIRAFSC